MPKFRQRRARQIARFARGVPSQPSIGRMQKRLPTRTPSTSIGCASGPDRIDGVVELKRDVRACEMVPKRRRSLQRRDPGIRWCSRDEYYARRAFVSLRVFESPVLGVAFVVLVLVVRPPKTRPQKPRFFFGCSPVSAAADHKFRRRFDAQRRRPAFPPWGDGPQVPPPTTARGTRQRAAPDEAKKPCSWQICVGAAPRSEVLSDDVIARRDRQDDRTAGRR